MASRPGLGVILGVIIAVGLFQVTFAAPVNESPENSQLEQYDGEAGCYYNFQHYDEGDRIVTNEPCLNCTCHNRMLMCYLRVCPFTKAIGQDCTIEKKPDQCCPVITCPEVPVKLVTSSTMATTPATPTGSTKAIGHPDNYGCTIGDTFYTDGAQMPGDPAKPCELCYCIRNRTACVMQECTLQVEGCRPVYQPGICCPVRYDCDYLEPTELPALPETTVYPTPGLILSTTTSGPLDCRYGDEIYADGASIDTPKPCEHCYCMRGDIVCAVQECGKPLEHEGKNCTPLPPLPGQCCPEQYQCDNGTLPFESLSHEKEEAGGQTTTMSISVDEQDSTKTKTTVGEQMSTQKPDLSEELPSSSTSSLELSPITVQSENVEGSGEQSEHPTAADHLQTLEGEQQISGTNVDTSTKTPHEESTSAEAVHGKPEHQTELASAIGDVTEGKLGEPLSTAPSIPNQSTEGVKHEEEAGIEASGQGDWLEMPVTGSAILEPEEQTIADLSGEQLVVVGGKGEEQQTEKPKGEEEGVITGEVHEHEPGKGEEHVTEGIKTDEQSVTELVSSEVPHDEEEIQHVTQGVEAAEAEQTTSVSPDETEAIIQHVTETIEDKFPSTAAPEQVAGEEIHHLGAEQISTSDPKLETEEETFHITMPTKEEQLTTSAPVYEQEDIQHQTEVVKNEFTITSAPEEVQHPVEVSTHGPPQEDNINEHATETVKGEELSMTAHEDEEKEAQGVTDTIKLESSSTTKPEADENEISIGNGFEQEQHIDHVINTESSNVNSEKDHVQYVTVASPEPVLSEDESAEISNEIQVTDTFGQQEQVTEIIKGEPESTGDQQEIEQPESEKDEESMEDTKGEVQEEELTQSVVIDDSKGQHDAEKETDVVTVPTEDKQHITEVMDQVTETVKGEEEISEDEKPSEIIKEEDKGENENETQLTEAEHIKGEEQVTEGTKDEGHVTETGQQITEADKVENQVSEDEKFEHVTEAVVAEEQGIKDTISAGEMDEEKHTEPEGEQMLPEIERVTEAVHGEGEKHEETATESAEEEEKGEEPASETGTDNEHVGEPETGHNQISEGGHEQVTEGVKEEEHVTEGVKEEEHVTEGVKEEEHVTEEETVQEGKDETQAPELTENHVTESIKVEEHPPAIGEDLSITNEVEHEEAFNKHPVVQQPEPENETEEAEMINEIEEEHATEVVAKPGVDSTSTGEKEETKPAEQPEEEAVAKPGVDSTSTDEREETKPIEQPEISQVSEPEKTPKPEINFEADATSQPNISEASMDGVSGGSTEQAVFATEAGPIGISTTSVNTPAFGVVPGEGACLVDGLTYPNNSAIPSVNPCQLGCRCVSSIVHCVLMNCPPPPSHLSNCMPVHQGGSSCCPTYTCDEDIKETLESDSQMAGTDQPSETGESHKTPLNQEELSQLTPEEEKQDSHEPHAPNEKPFPEIPVIEIPAEKPAVSPETIHIPEHTPQEIPAEISEDEHLPEHVPDEKPEGEHTSEHVQEEIPAEKPVEHIPQEIVTDKPEEPQKVEHGSENISEEIITEKPGVPQNFEHVPEEILTEKPEEQHNVENMPENVPVEMPEEKPEVEHMPEHVPEETIAEKPEGPQVVDYVPEHVPEQTITEKSEEIPTEKPVEHIPEHIPEEPITEKSEEEQVPEHSSEEISAGKPEIEHMPEHVPGEQQEIEHKPEHVPEEIFTEKPEEQQEIEHKPEDKPGEPEGDQKVEHMPEHVPEEVITLKPEVEHIPEETITEKPEVEHVPEHAPEKAPEGQQEIEHHPEHISGEIITEKPEQNQEIEHVPEHVPEEIITEKSEVEQVPEETLTEKPEAEHTPEEIPEGQQEIEHQPEHVPGETITEKPEGDKEIEHVPEHAPDDIPGQEEIEHQPEHVPGETITEKPEGDQEVEHAPGEILEGQQEIEHEPEHVPGGTITEKPEGDQEIEHVPEHVSEEIPGEQQEIEHHPEHVPGETVTEKPEGDQEIEHVPEHVPEEIPGEQQEIEHHPEHVPGETVTEKPEGDQEIEHVPEHVPEKIPGEQQEIEHHPEHVPGETVTEKPEGDQKVEHAPGEIPEGQQEIEHEPEHVPGETITEKPEGDQKVEYVPEHAPGEILEGQQEIEHRPEHVPGETITEKPEGDHEVEHVPEHEPEEIAAQKPEVEHVPEYVPEHVVTDKPEDLQEVEHVPGHIPGETSEEIPGVTQEYDHIPEHVPEEPFTEKPEVSQGMEPIPQHTPEEPLTEKPEAALELDHIIEHMPEETVPEKPEVSQESHPEETIQDAAKPTQYPPAEIEAHQTTVGADLSLGSAETTTAPKEHSEEEKTEQMPISEHNTEHGTVSSSPAQEHPNGDIPEQVLTIIDTEQTSSSSPEQMPVESETIKSEEEIEQSIISSDQTVTPEGIESDHKEILEGSHAEDSQTEPQVSGITTALPVVDQKPVSGEQPNQASETSQTPIHEQQPQEVPVESEAVELEHPEHAVIDSDAMHTLLPEVTEQGQEVLPELKPQHEADETHTEHHQIPDIGSSPIQHEDQEMISQTPPTQSGTITEEDKTAAPEEILIPESKPEESSFAPEDQPEKIPIESESLAKPADEEKSTIASVVTAVDHTTIPGHVHIETSTEDAKIPEQAPIESEPIQTEGPEITAGSEVPLTSAPPQPIPDSETEKAVISEVQTESDQGQTQPSGAEHEGIPAEESTAASSSERQPEHTSVQPETSTTSQAIVKPGHLHTETPASHISTSETSTEEDIKLELPLEPDTKPEQPTEIVGETSQPIVPEGETAQDIEQKPTEVGDEDSKAEVPSQETEHEVVNEIPENGTPHKTEVTASTEISDIHHTVITDEKWTSVPEPLFPLGESQDLTTKSPLAIVTEHLTSSIATTHGYEELTGGFHFSTATLLPSEKPATQVPPIYTTKEPSEQFPGHFPPIPESTLDYDEEDDQAAFGPGTCRYGGKVYVSAQQIPRDDPCDFCFCFRSDIICLQQSCPPPIPGCHEEPINGFCCPRYECPVSKGTAVNVTTTTTTTTTMLPPHFPSHVYKGAAVRMGCQIRGQTYRVGELIRSASGPCLSCRCGGDGKMKCDPKVCSPEPMLRKMITAAESSTR